MNLKPIRKVAIGFTAMGITWALQRIGLDLGPEWVNGAAIAIVGGVASWAAKDPRVLSAEEYGQKLYEDVKKAIDEAEKRGS